MLGWRQWVASSTPYRDIFEDFLNLSKKVGLGLIKVGDTKVIVRFELGVGFSY
jgi:hypothetical protein